jgi:sec-independent protein translocase protein TatA
MNFGFVELLIILVIVIVLFGASRLPALGEGLGKAIRGFKDSMKGSDAPPGPPISTAPRSGGEGTPPAKKELPPEGGAQN